MSEIVRVGGNARLSSAVLFNGMIFLAGQTASDRMHNQFEYSMVEFDLDERSLGA